MGFRKIRGINVSYARQGQIYFALANYEAMPPKTRTGVDRLIHQAAYAGRTQGEAYEKALRAWLIEGRGYNQVIRECCVNERALLEKRKWIYENW